MHLSSLVSIRKRFQCVPLKDLPLGHSCGCLLQFSQLSFLHAEQEDGVYFFYPPLNFNVPYIAIAQAQFRSLEGTPKGNQTTEQTANSIAVKKTPKLHNEKTLTVTTEVFFSFLGKHGFSTEFITTILKIG